MFLHDVVLNGGELNLLEKRPVCLSCTCISHFREGFLDLKTFLPIDRSFLIASIFVLKPFRIPDFWKLAFWHFFSELLS